MAEVVAGSIPLLTWGAADARGRYESTEPHAKINVSLLALGRVLTALAKNHSHVPYRDSVLTRLLQGVLGDGGATCMLACIHPGESHAAETGAVLEYCKVTASIERKVTRAEVKDIRTAAEREMEVRPCNARCNAHCNAHG